MVLVKQTAAVVEAQVRIGRTGTGKKSAVQPTGLSKFFNYLPPNIDPGLVATDILLN